MGARLVQAPGLTRVAGRTSSERAALDGQSRRIMEVFTRAGFDFIAPDILQPADMFLDSSGEGIRQTAYVFTDPAGRELCLRPDLTVPACRYHLSHAAIPASEARYCYCGPAFRFQAGAGDSGRAEFDQAGIEWFNAPRPAAAEAAVVKLAIDAVEAAGLRSYRVRLGDLGLFDALLRSLDMPERWRRKLRHQFWRPAAFHALLDLLTGAQARARTGISGHVDAVAEGNLAAAVGHVGRELERGGLALSGGRTVEEIATRLLEKAEDCRDRPLDRAARDRIDAYLAIEGDASGVRAGLRRVGGDKAAFADAVGHYEARLAELERREMAPDRFLFTAGFGRDLEYYTGLVFEIEAEVGGGRSQVAGGGRYDALFSDIGSPVPVPAVGCAIYAERLLAAVAASQTALPR
ncbi:MAG: ATP phosphoribosyltransferase regulatory subunit [Pseudomonadota bacterium]|nr:ATP phosphoribosyltransferase regulatory subunit [Pseudomonadota bacterium]